MTVPGWGYITKDRAIWPIVALLNIVLRQTSRVESPLTCEDGAVAGRKESPLALDAFALGCITAELKVGEAKDATQGL